MDLLKNFNGNNIQWGIAELVLIDGVIYGLAYRPSNWFSVNAETGKEKILSDKFRSGVIIYSNGLFYCHNDQGEIALVKMTPDTFQTINKFDVSLGTDQHWAHLVILDKCTYIRHGNDLMVYNISK